MFSEMVTIMWPVVFVQVSLQGQQADHNAVRRSNGIDDAERSLPRSRGPELHTSQQPSLPRIGCLDQSELQTSYRSVGNVE
jgi:hypothetical protein